MSNQAHSLLCGDKQLIKQLLSKTQLRLLPTPCSLCQKEHISGINCSLSPCGWGAGDQQKSSPPQPSAWGHRGQGDPGRDRLLSLCTEPAGCQSGRSLTNPHECDGGTEEGAAGWRRVRFCGAHWGDTDAGGCSGSVSFLLLRLPARDSSMCDSRAQ